MQQQQWAGRPLGPPRITLGIRDEPMPQAVMLFAWPDQPGVEIESYLHLDDVNNLIDGLVEARDLLQERLDNLEGT
jgi:hypothetical protein